MSKQTFRDRVLHCTGCQKEFTWSALDQAFYSEKGLTHEPKRCKPCRDLKNARFQRGEKVVTVTICEECRESCSVPFEPILGTPIYCRRCFVQRSDFPGK